MPLCRDGHYARTNSPDGAREMAQHKLAMLVHPRRHVTWYGDDAETGVRAQGGGAKAESKTKGGVLSELQ
jgi:hypothetical protein